VRSSSRRAIRGASTGRPHAARRGDHIGDPEVWDEIARRIEDEGHTPTDERPFRYGGIPSLYQS